MRIFLILLFFYLVISSYLDLILYIIEEYFDLMDQKYFMYLIIIISIAILAFLLIATTHIVSFT